MFSFRTILSCSWHLHRYLHSAHSTFKGLFVCVVLILELHILNYDFWEIDVCYVAIAFSVHLLTERRVACIGKGVPAPMLSILLSYLMYWEMISLRFSQFWYQSNSVQFLYNRWRTQHTFSPKRSVCRNDYSFQNTSI